MCVEFSLRERLLAKKRYLQAMNRYFSENEIRFIERFIIFYGAEGAVLNTNKGMFQIDIYKGKMTIYNLDKKSSSTVRYAKGKITKQELLRYLQRARRKEIKCIAIDE